MRRYIVSPELGYSDLLDLVETTYEQDGTLEFNAIREGIVEKLNLKPNLVERRRDAGRKVLEVLGVEVNTLDPFIATSEFPDNDLQNPQTIQVTIREKTGL